MNSEGAKERRPFLREGASRISIPAAVEERARVVVDAALEVHRTIGPGLLESTYEACLATELEIRNPTFRRQVRLPTDYKGRRIDVAYRLDLVVDDLLIVEIKAVEAISELHQAQLISYLRLVNFPLGLLINFNVPLIRDGIHRILNLRWQNTPSPSFAPSLLRC